MTHRTAPRALHPLLQGIAVSSLAMFALAARAHDAWVDTKDQGYAVFYGHDDHRDTYLPSKVKAVVARDAQGVPVEVKRQDGKDSVAFTASARPALMTLAFDNGFWTTAGENEPSKNLPKAEVPGATSTLHALKYGKTVFAWSAAVIRPQGQRLELVPLSAEAPKAGGTLPVQVLWEGQPLAGAKIVRAAYSKERPIATDAEGKAQIPVAAGKQMLTVGHKRAVSGNPQVDSESIASNLVFTAQ